MNKNTKAKAELDRRNIRAQGKGPNVNSSLARAASGRKPWKGAGDPLKRGRPDYNMTTPNPQGRRFFRTPEPIGVQVDFPDTRALSSRTVVDLIGL